MSAIEDKLNLHAGGCATYRDGPCDCLSAAARAELAALRERAGKLEEALREARVVLDQFAHEFRWGDSHTRARQATIDIDAALAQSRAREGEGKECQHVFEANPGMYDTSHRYCAKCGVAE